MSLRKQTISGLYWTFFEQFGRTGIKFIVQLFLARLISPNQFGLLGMIAIFYVIGESLASTGLNQSLIRMSNPKEIDYSTVFWINLIVSFIVYLIIFFCAPYISSFYDLPILTSIVRVYALSIFINCFSAIQLTKYTKELNFKIQTTVILPSIIISSILGIYLAYLGWGVWSLVYMQVAQTSISALQLWIRSSWKPKFIYDFKRAKYHFTFGYKLMLTSLFNNIFINIYPMIIGKFNNPTQVGYYSRAMSFRSLPVTMTIGVFNKVTFPILAELKNDTSRFEIVFIKFYKILVLLSSFVLCSFIVSAKPLILLLIGDQWIKSVIMFQWVALGGVFIVLQSYLSNVLIVYGRSDFILKALIYSRILNIIILINTAPLGIMTIIYGQVVSEFINAFILQFFINKTFNFSILKQFTVFIPILIPSIIITITLLIVFPIIESQFANKWLQLLILLGSFISFFSIIQYFINKSLFIEIYHMRKLIKT